MEDFLFFGGGLVDIESVMYGCFRLSSGHLIMVIAVVVGARGPVAHAAMSVSCGVFKELRKRECPTLCS